MFVFSLQLELELRRNACLLSSNAPYVGTWSDKQGDCDPLCLACDEVIPLIIYKTSHDAKGFVS